MKPRLPERRKRRERPPASPRRMLLGLSLVIVVALVVLWLTSYLVTRLTA
ncbi:hypothetical protein KTN05_13815 [Paracoccus sp. Z118]|nr:hypothetical protein [Paracoccus sp. Z118]MBV0892920.1 hypothetical protein [Paracoccus sp. Z118]